MYKNKNLKRQKKRKKKKKTHRRPKYFKTIKGTETPLDLTGRYRDIPQ